MKGPRAQGRPVTPGWACAALAIGWCSLAAGERQNETSQNGACDSPSGKCGTQSSSWFQTGVVGRQMNSMWEGKNGKDETGSPTLQEMNDEVLALAERVAGHDHTMSDDEKQALVTMRGFISRMQKDSVVQHGEDQEEVDRSRDMIGKCAAQAKEKLRPQKGLMETAAKTRKQHETERKSQSKLAHIANRHCSIYYEYLSHGVKRRPPECMKSAFETDEDKKTIGACLELSKPWLDPLWELYIKCKEANQKVAEKKKKSDAEQAVFEGVFCEASSLSDVACDAQKSCREMTVKARNKAHEAVTLSEEARKADWKTVARILCLLDVLIAKNEHKKEGLAKCMKKTYDTSQFDIKYHPIPDEQPCPKKLSPPCTSVFLNEEYVKKEWNKMAPATECKPCGLPTAAKSSGRQRAKHFFEELAAS